MMFILVNDLLFAVIPAYPLDAAWADFLTLMRKKFYVLKNLPDNAAGATFL